MLQHRQNGFALFQVLIMVSIISILMILVMQYALRATQQSDDLQSAVNKQLALYSTMNLIEFELATQPWSGQNSVAQRWQINFHGQPQLISLPERRVFSAINSEAWVTIQNQRSLLDLRDPDEDNFRRIAVASGIAEERVSALYRSLQLWQLRYNSANRSRVQAGQSAFAELTHWSELTSVPGWTEDDMLRLRNVVTFHGQDLNLAHAPELIVNALLPATQADIVAAWREQRRTGPIDGIGQVALDQVPRRVQHISLEQGNVRLHRLVEIRPHNRQPLRRIVND